MNEEKLNGTNALDDENQLTKEGKKRVSYAAKDLKFMIDFVAKVYNQLGHTTFHSNKAIATVHGMSADSIKPHLTSGQLYKLLELKHRVGYKITEHFQKLYLPKNDIEKRAAVIESLKHGDIYQQLFKDYEYHVVPSEGVKNHFIRTFDVKDDIATRAAQVFMENLRDFQLLDGRGVLTSALPLKGTLSDGKQETEESNSETGNEEPPVTPDETPPQRNPPPTVIQTNEYTGSSKYLNHIWIPIHITKGQTAVFAYPEGISENDIKIVEHQLAGILLRIRLENEEKKGAETPL